MGKEKERRKTKCGLEKKDKVRQGGMVVLHEGGEFVWSSCSRQGEKTGMIH